MKRSNEQSKYRWTVVIPMIRDFLKSRGFSYTADQVNFMMKLCTGHYIERLKLPDGEYVKMELPTNKGSIVDFEAWLGDVRDYAYDTYGLDIPTPNAVPLKFYNEENIR